MESPRLTYRLFNGTPVGQRLSDGYWDGTALCKAHGKQISGYLRIDRTKEFLQVLADEEGMPVLQNYITEQNHIVTQSSGLVQVIQGGDPSAQGTWLHPLVIINCAQWCDRVTEVKVTKLVFQWMMSGNSPTADGSLNYVIGNMLREVQTMRNKRMRGTIWREHDDKGMAVKHMIDFQTAEFHRFHPQYEWPKDFVMAMYQHGHLGNKGVSYREALRRLGQEAEAATLATMDQGREQYDLDDQKAIDFGYGFLAGFENAKRLGVQPIEVLMAMKRKEISE